MAKYTKHFQTKQTKQTEPIPGKNQVKNNAGGYTFKITPEAQFKRFLILGSDGGSYYQTENDLTVENAENAVEFIKQDGVMAVKLIAEISDQGRAAKNSPAIFALALVCTFGSPEAKACAYKAIPVVCRIGTHIFEFCQYIQDLRGWSRGLRKGVASYFEKKVADSNLALDVIKYRQRDGWTHKDVLRLSHPSISGNDVNSVLKWAVGKEVTEKNALISAFEQIQKTTNVNEAVKLIEENNLPREAVPTDLLNSADIWNALLVKMPMKAMIRNLGKMTSINLLKSNFGEQEKRVIASLTNVEALSKARIHPLDILVALKIYSQGHSERGSLSWRPVPGIVEALNEAFYLSFKNVAPLGKNFLIGLDVSGSMSSRISDSNSLTSREATSAISLLLARTEKSAEVFAFSNSFMPLTVHKNLSLEGLMRKTESLPFQGTDCALPMLHATRNKIDNIDCFIVLTDSETWAGNIHPSQALLDYRRQFNPEAKLIVLATVPSAFTIADPTDAGYLDIAGFDSSVYSVMQEFLKGW